MTAIRVPVEAAFADGHLPFRRVSVEIHGVALAPHFLIDVSERSQVVVHGTGRALLPWQMRLTAKKVLSWTPCWQDFAVEEYFHGRSLRLATPARDQSLSIGDRVWLVGAALESRDEDRAFAADFLLRHAVRDDHDRAAVAEFLSGRDSILYDEGFSELLYDCLGNMAYKGCLSYTYLAACSLEDHDIDLETVISDALRWLRAE